MMAASVIKSKIRRARTKATPPRKVARKARQVSRSPRRPPLEARFRHEQRQKHGQRQEKNTAADDGELQAHTGQGDAEEDPAE